MTSAVSREAIRQTAGATAFALRAFEVARFGSHALALRERLLAARRLTLDEFKGRGQSRRLVDARQETAYRAWTECEHLSLDDVAKLIGRSDHSAATHAILAGARANGIIAAKVSQLRGHTDPVDWVKLAYHAAAARNDDTIERTARRAGIGRAEWRKVEQGRAVSAATLLLVCRWLGADPFAYLRDADASHETNVKHEVPL